MFQSSYPIFCSVKEQENVRKDLSISLLNVMEVCHVSGPFYGT